MTDPRVVVNTSNQNAKRGINFSEITMGRHEYYQIRYDNEIIPIENWEELEKIAKDVRGN